MQNKINASIILHHIQSHGPISRAAIAKDLKISAPAVSRAASKLIEKKWVIETKKAPTKRGKRPFLLVFNKNRSLVLNIDLAKERAQMALTNLHHEIIWKRQSFLIEDNKAVLGQIQDEIADVLRMDKGPVDFLSIAVPAGIDTESGEITGGCLYTQWSSINLKKEMGSRFGLKTFVDNDVNLSAIGEKKYGQGKDAACFVFLEISNGIGAGIIIHDELVRGAQNSAGEVGLALSDRKSIGRMYSKEGCMENFSTIAALKREVAHRLKKEKSAVLERLTEGRKKSIELDTILEASKNGCSICKNALDGLIENIAYVIANIVSVLNPDIIVIGGDITAIKDMEEEWVKKIGSLLKKSHALNIPLIKAAVLGKDAGIIGCSHYAVASTLLDDFPYHIKEKQ